MITRPFNNHRSRATSEEGFSLIELLIAILLLAIGIIGLVSTLDGSRDLSNNAERLGVATAVAERFIERYSSRQYRYNEVGLTAAPTAAADTGDPNANYPDIKLCGTTTSYRWDQTDCPSVAPLGDTLITGGDFPPTQAWTDARTGARGLVHTYVTRVNNACPDAPRTSGCADQATPDYKRITIAVSIRNGPPDRPIVLTTLLADPNGLPAGQFPNPYLANDLVY